MLFQRDYLSFFFVPASLVLIYIFIIYF
jgi:hypothetical protein